MDTYTPPPQEQDPYHFIMNGQNTPKKGLLAPLRPGSFRNKLLLIVGGIAAITAVILLASLIFGGKENNAQALLGLMAHQQEIIRVSDLGLKSAIDSSTKGYAETVKLSMSSEQSELKSYLTKKKQKITPVQLASKKDAQTDDVLAGALKSNRFDDTLTETLKTLLTEYQKDLGKSYANASTPESKAILKNASASTTALLK